MNHLGTTAVALVAVKIRQWTEVAEVTHIVSLVSHQPADETNFSQGHRVYTA